MAVITFQLQSRITNDSSSSINKKTYSTNDTQRLSVARVLYLVFVGCAVVVQNCRDPQAGVRQKVIILVVPLLQPNYALII